MKKIFLLTFFILCSLVVEAQELNWHTDMKQAVKISNKEKKPLMILFTGSTWCGWCIRLQNEVLKTPEFKKWAKENVVLVELDYPRGAVQTPQNPEIVNQNAELQQAFGVRGYPTVHFATAESKDGKVNFNGLGNTGYVAGGPTSWLAVAGAIIKSKKM
ncbi:thioredoxin family protein [Flavobacterium pectinovorum]|uniref:thioredoxin family protein n=1 Tax=Flavobacterium pectinovorum TaxID=29533 RepID=UPI001FAD0158|nr:thioredoxin family protein [Flavobacterium pectinovorum]MCI9845162.1 thioredoxin family protein [Flavobacterium pectinovorum]